MANQRIEDVLNERLDRIWLKHCSDVSDALVPAYFHQIRRPGLLFIGMNPSFKESEIRTALRRQGFDISNLREYFSWKHHTTFDREVSFALDRWAIDQYRYFAPHRALAKSVNRAFGHLDLYAWRASNQKDCLALMESMNGFADDQLEVFDSALTAAGPDAVLVFNAKASRIFSGLYSSKFDEEAGHYWLRLADARIPLFYSGMLTGGATDQFSRERLFWLVKRSLRRTDFVE